MTEEKTDEQVEAAKEKKSSLAFLIIISAIVLALAGIYFGVKYFYTPPPRYETMEYNGFTFTKIEGTWYTQWQDNGQLFNIPFRYNPEETKEVPIIGKLNTTFDSKTIYITFNPLSDPDDFKYLTLASYDLGQSLIRALKKNVSAACTVNETDACINRPILTCENDDKAVIFLKPEGDQPVLNLEGNCLIIQGKGLELIRVVDRVLYQWYRIIR